MKRVIPVRRRVAWSAPPPPPAPADPYKRPDGRVQIGPEDV